MCTPSSLIIDPPPLPLVEKNFLDFTRGGGGQLLGTTFSWKTKQFFFSKKFSKNFFEKKKKIGKIIFFLVFTRGQLLGNFGYYLIVKSYMALVSLLQGTVKIKSSIFSKARSSVISKKKTSFCKKFLYLNGGGDFRLVQKRMKSGLGIRKYGGYSIWHCSPTIYAMITLRVWIDINLPWTLYFCNFYSFCLFPTDLHTFQ